MPVSKADLVRGVMPTVHQMFQEGVRETDIKRDMLYNVMQSNQESEHFEGVGDLPIEGFYQYNKQGTIGQGTFSRGWEKTFKHREYPYDIPIKWAWIRSRSASMIRVQSMKIGRLYRQFIETEAASTFNNAFSTSHTGPDGKALCASDHPQAPNNAVTWDNSGTTAFSADAIEATHDTMALWEGDTGYVLGIQPDIILVPQGLRAEAMRQLSSTLKPGTDHNDININNNQYRLIVWPYLTDTNNWFMIDSREAMQSLFWFNREEMDIDPEAIRKNQVDVFFSMLASFSYGWTSAKFIYGHAVT